MKRPKTQQWAGKIMASVFWDAHSILFIDYLEKGKTINSDYYMALLDRLSGEIKKIRPHMQNKRMLFHQDNVRWSNCMNWASNCFLTHHILQIRPPATTGSMLIWKNCPREKNLAPMKEWLPKLRPILRADESLYKKRHQKVRKALE